MGHYSKRMERMQMGSEVSPAVLIALLPLSFVGDLSALSVRVRDVECVYDYVLYDGDTTSGNFVVVDQGGTFWNSDHPGMDLIVTPSSVYEHLDPVHVEIAELRDALESVTAEQKYLKARDAQHRHTNESTQKRVVFYTIAEYVLLCVVSALQVLFLTETVQ